MTVLAHSLDGCLRLRELGGGLGVVELRSHLYPGRWTWCVWEYLHLDRAMDLFMNQARHHTDPSKFFKPVVDPGV